jgi:hypothetical protein
MRCLPLRGRYSVSARKGLAPAIECWERVCRGQRCACAAAAAGGAINAAATAPVLEGDEWERFCVQALEYRHKTDFQKVPARHRGDYGLDGYIRSSTVFQCYGDQAGTSSTERAKAQKRKLNTELPKLKRNAAPIKALVGTGVQNYVFLVSQLNDKSVVEHAGEWTATVLTWKLDYLADDFAISVKDIDYLKAEWDLLYGALKAKLALVFETATDEAVSSWRESENELTTTLRRKLVKIAGPDAVDHWDEMLVRERLTELDLMASLRGYGDIWQRVRELRAAREDGLGFRSVAPSPAADVLALQADYARELRDEVSSLQSDNAASLAWGAIADWLMRCPLDYAT